MLSKRHIDKSLILFKSTCEKYINSSFASNPTSNSSNSIDENEKESQMYSQNKSTDTLAKSRIVKKTTIEKFKELLEFKGGNIPPTNLSFIDKRGGMIQLDADIPLSVLFEDAPKILKQEAKVF
jgi:hypothetical protein